MTVKNNETEKQNKKKLDWKFLASCVVSAAALAVAVVACVNSGKTYTGPQGPVGPAGLPGNNGQPGTNGTDGTSMLTGSDIPADTLGKNGDSYIDLSTWDFYVKANDVWDKLGNIKGEAGAAGQNGSTGSAGTNGTDGTSMLTGSGIPENTLGKNGDSYIDLSKWDFYVKANDEWVKSGNIKGKDGTSGEGGGQPLSSMDDYFDLVNSTRKYNYNLTLSDGRINLTNENDINTIYNNVEPSSYCFDIKSSSLKTQIDDYKYDNDTPDNPDDDEKFEQYAYFSNEATATMQINKIGDDVAIHLESLRACKEVCYVPYIDIAFIANSEDLTMYIADYTTFTKIGEQYYMFYSSPTFGYYIIQEFTESFYKLVVSSLIYEITNFPYKEGTDYFIERNGCEFYKTDFSGSETANGANARYGNSYVSEFTCDDDNKLLSLSLEFKDTFGVMEIDPTMYFPNFVTQKLNIIYGDSGYEYPTSVPTGGVWDDADYYFYDVSSAAVKEKLGEPEADYDSDLDVCAALIYQITDIFRNSYLGIPLVIA